MHRRVPRTVLVAAGLAILIIAAGIHAGRGRLVEAWQILRLRSGDETTRLDAAEKLADMKSVAAVPHLIRIVAGEDSEGVPHWIGGGMIHAYGPQGCTSIPTETLTGIRLTPMAHALFSIGSGALPALRVAIQDEWARIDREMHSSGNLRLVSILIEISRAIEGKDGNVEKSNH